MDNNGWDLIVIGAGSSGAALAARSAAQGKNVLLLEAGADYRSAELPDVWRSPNPWRALGDPTACADYMWQGLVASRTDSQDPAPFWRGRGVGGSSTINGQIAIRPPMEDFDDWVLAGCRGWSREDVLPYFARLEDDEQFRGSPYHGTSGPIPIHRTPKELWGSVDRALYRAALAAGHDWAEDVNAPGAVGVSPYPINSRDGRRVSTNDAYLEPGRDLTTLTICGDALVDQVLFAENRAIGVQVLLNSRSVSLYADRIALCAGAIHSPALLLRSGIGPAAHLKDFAIAVRSDLPVGQGLQDHPLNFVRIPLNEQSMVSAVDDRHTNVCVRYTSGDPDGQFLDMMMVAGNQTVLAMENPDRSGMGSFGLWLDQVYSRGSVALASSNPLVQPHVHERMLSDDRDLRRMRNGIRHLVELASHDVVAPIRQRPVETLNQKLFSALDNDDTLNEFLLATSMDAQHATSTCRMGDSSDSTSVVDPQCRVLGVEGLYVVDASILPTVPRANTHLVAVMIGELMSDRID